MYYNISRCLCPKALYLYYRRKDPCINLLIILYIVSYKYFAHIMYINTHKFYKIIIYDYQLGKHCRIYTKGRVSIVQITKGA